MWRGASNSATRTLPAQARNASSCWLRSSRGTLGHEAQDLVRCLARQRSLRAPWALRAAARAGWARKWWGQLGPAKLRVAARLGVDATWRRLASAGAARGRRARAHRSGPRARRGRALQLASASVTVQDEHTAVAKKTFDCLQQRGIFMGSPHFSNDRAKWCHPFPKLKAS